ncbi:MAG: FtsX-like permease family protein [Planctomycetes bacterium]|nr:FtsX-like permease family protein [Planctomycetota bacterium]
MTTLGLVETVALGLKSLRLHKMRSALAALGIVFGVCSVIAMLSIGEGASREAQDQIKLLGTNNIIVRGVKPVEEKTVTQARRFVLIYGLTYDDAEHIATTLPSVKVTVPMRRITQDVRYRHRRTEGAVVGTVPWYPQIANFRPAQGRFLTYTDMHESAITCVLGQAIARDLFTYEDPIGQKVKVGRDYFTVVGVMESRSLPEKEGDRKEVGDLNQSIFIPLTTARTRFGEYLVRRTTGTFQAESVQLHEIIVQVADMAEVFDTAKAVTAILEKSHKKKDYEVIVPLELLRQAERTKRIFSIVLGSIAAISLLVGGIGIMNIMLATVTERTREIGIRRALGAKRKHVIAQFLVETVVLTVCGGLTGIGLGVVIPLMVTWLANMRTVITPLSLVLSFGISVGVGILFGLYPAWRAAQMDPIEALRHE